MNKCVMNMVGLECSYATRLSNSLDYKILNPELKVFQEEKKILEQLYYFSYLNKFNYKVYIGYFNVIIYFNVMIFNVFNGSYSLVSNKILAKTNDDYCVLYINIIV